ncbi:MAG: cyclic-di-AMP receptor [Tissierellia bacterium]|nr:cyclic-di-AMP receptor [Tissierellia bacterium]
MKLLIAIVQDQDVDFLTDALTDKGYRITKLATTGGFLKKGNTTLLLGIEDSQVDEVIDMIKENCKKRTAQTQIVNPTAETAMFQSIPMEINVGGATVFLIDVEKYLRI